MLPPASLQYVRGKNFAKCIQFFLAARNLAVYLAEGLAIG
jgi:hypothetical protein